MKKKKGLSTGFRDLDSYTLFYPGDLIVLDGSLSMNTVALASDIAQLVTKQRNSVLIFTLITNTTIFMSKFVSLNAQNNFWEDGLPIKNGADYQQAVGDIDNFSLFIDDIARSVIQIRKSVKEKKEEEDVTLIIIDYILLMTELEKSEITDRRQELIEIIREIKILARELNIPILITTHLERIVKHRKDKKPILSDSIVAEVIKQEADVLLLLNKKESYNEDDEPEIADLTVTKNHNGKTGSIKLKLNTYPQRFVDVETGSKNGTEDQHRHSEFINTYLLILKHGTKIIL